MTAAARFGQLLREARELRGLTIEQVSSETHIPLGHIEALESGRIEALPGAMYRRAEARAYADAVGLDARVVLAALQRAIDGNESAAELTTARVGAADVPAVAVDTVPVSRLARAVLVLVLGCAALLWQQPDEPTAIATATTLPAITTDTLEEVITRGEPARPAATIKRVLFDPRIAANGKRWPRDERLDQGVLVVHSTPRGARVTVNGVGWGATPIAIRYLPEGTVRVRVAKPRFRSAERVVTVRDGEPSRIAIRLRPLS